MSAFNYDSVAPFYEQIANIFSFGRIKASKYWQLHYLQKNLPGSCILFVGVGAGEDAEYAARIGLHVTCIDVSQKMLARARARIERAGYSAQYFCCDINHFTTTSLFDVVAANYFLNCFSIVSVKGFLNRFRSLLQPEGLLMVADFAMPPSRSFPRLLQILYFRYVNTLFTVIGKVSFHPLYDYNSLLQSAGFSTQSIKLFPLFPFLQMPSYCSWICSLNHNSMLPPKS